MKKTLLKLAFCFLVIGNISCSTEKPIDPLTMEQEMTPEMENFKDALIEWVKAKNIASQSQLTEYNPNEVILTQAKDLLKSENILIQAKRSSTAENEGIIISQAMRVFIEKSNNKK